jgi:hypothetical protein
VEAHDGDRFDAAPRGACVLAASRDPQTRCAAIASALAFVICLDLRHVTVTSRGVPDVTLRFLERSLHHAAILPRALRRRRLEGDDDDDGSGVGGTDQAPAVGGLHAQIGEQLGASGRPAYASTSSMRQAA